MDLMFMPSATKPRIAIITSAYDAYGKDVNKNTSMRLFTKLHEASSGKIEMVQVPLKGKNPTSEDLRVALYNESTRNPLSGIICLRVIPGIQTSTVFFGPSMLNTTYEPLNALVPSLAAKQMSLESGLHFQIIMAAKNVIFGAWAKRMAVSYPADETSFNQWYLSLVNAFKKIDALPGYSKPTMKKINGILRSISPYLANDSLLQKLSSTPHQLETFIKDAAFHDRAGAVRAISALAFNAYREYRKSLGIELEDMLSNRLSFAIENQVIKEEFRAILKTNEKSLDSAFASVASQENYPIFYVPVKFANSHESGSLHAAGGVAGENGKEIPFHPCIDLQFTPSDAKNILSEAYFSSFSHIVEDWARQAAKFMQLARQQE